MPKLSLIASVAALALGVAACGGSSSSSSTSSSTSSAATSSAAASSSAAAPASGASSTLSLAADPSGQLKYDKKALTAKAGKVTIDFTNHAPLAHNLTIQQGTNGAGVGATPT